MCASAPSKAVKKSITVRDTGTDTADITSENEESILRFLELPDHKHEIQLSAKELKLHASKVQKIKGIDGIVIGLQYGPGKPTCMYFPWDAGDTTYCGPSVDFFMKKMKEVGGGLKAEHEYTVTRKMAYKGWSECRICKQRNGSEEYLLSTGMLVPVGARHYKTEHKIPLNLWSIPISNSVSLYYIAKHPI